MSIEKLHTAFETKDTVVLAQVGEYCMIDSVRLQQLVYCDKMKIIESLVSLALVVYCPLEYIHHRGQQVRVGAQIFRTAKKLSFKIPDTVTDFTLGDCRPRNRFDDNGMICNNVMLPPVSWFENEDEYPHEEEDDNEEDHPSHAIPETKLKVTFLDSLLFSH